MNIRAILKKNIRAIVKKCYPEIELLSKKHAWWYIDDSLYDNNIDETVKIYSPSNIYDTTIGRYTYIQINSFISKTTIGQFCSIGPNLVCGWGVHPINGISTSPMFYSTKKQNGYTLSNTDKTVERKHINIGNDVFIGANVTILDGVTIGDGAVIGAGAVVSKDIPAYAIAVGSPIRIIRYRFTDEVISSLKKTKWWDYDEVKLREIERYIFNVDDFIKQNSHASY